MSRPRPAELQHLRPSNLAGALAVGAVGLTTGTGIALAMQPGAASLGSRPDRARPGDGPVVRRAPRMRARHPLPHAPPPPDRRTHCRRVRRDPLRLLDADPWPPPPVDRVAGPGPDDGRAGAPRAPAAGADDRERLLEALDSPLLDHLSPGKLLEPAAAVPVLRLAHRAHPDGAGRGRPCRALRGDRVLRRPAEAARDVRAGAAAQPDG